jgi:hypothetical protein
MPPSALASVVAELAAVANPECAKSSAWFFKTGKGEYGEGDQFLGVNVPTQRKIALRHLHLSHAAIRKLLASQLHEHRFVALEILALSSKQLPPTSRPGFTISISRIPIASTIGI